jgi:hypothetical protein
MPAHSTYAAKQEDLEGDHAPIPAHLLLWALG